jgi:hypothetical protein
MTTVWDAENDAFVRPLHCPHCQAPSPVVPDAPREAALCAFCGRTFELVRVVVGEGQGALSMYVARRPQLAFCSVTGEPLDGASLVEWSTANGNAGRSGVVVDPRGVLFGVPHRDVAWDLALEWSQPRFGNDDAVRPDEVVTSVCAWKGTVVAVTASGLVGLFDPDSGAPLLAHAISWPGVDIEDDDHVRAVRLPPALRGMTMVLGTDRTVLVRDMAPALGVRTQQAGRLFVAVDAPAGQQWIGPPLLAGDATCSVVLVRGVVDARGVTGAVIEVLHGAGAALGERRALLDVDDVVRPPVWAAGSHRVVWVNKHGHIGSLDVDAAVPQVQWSLPQRMLSLAPRERSLLLVVDGGAGGDELWLADDSDGLRVWRAPLGRIMAADDDWSWEPLLETRDVGALRGFALGPASSASSTTSARAAQLYVLATERATAAFTRALKSTASESVLARAPIAPPVLTPVGYLSQDRQGLWLRALPPWSFPDDNPERFLDPGVPEPRPAFYDRTFAVVGRQVFFAHAGRIHAARLVPRHARTAPLEGRS